ncbi:MAG: acetate kinase [Lutibacter sp.]|nr:acetate kinase [Lutibacter sp.]
MQQKILVINSGSSSVKYQLFDMPDQQVICAGLVERIGMENARITYKTAADTLEEQDAIADHEAGLSRMLSMLTDPNTGVLSSTDEVQAVGHRVVHGGSSFSETTIITEQVKDKIKELYSLAPQHNPANYQGIEVAEKMFPQATQLAVFDTAFYQSIPQTAYQYAIPTRFLTEHNIRKYGFHGTSHKYVSEKAIEWLGTSTSNIISIHLGNGCSMSAIKDGQCIDTTLGFGPVTGLIMGTRCGDIDHAILVYLVKHLGYSLEEVNQLLQAESGMLGLTGYSDLRDIEAAAAEGDKACQLALEMSAYRIRQYIGAYTASLNGLDALVFTAGIGENSELIRQLVCRELDCFGISLDSEKNRIPAKGIREIQAAASRVRILVIPTNEELEIARQSYALIANT